MRLHKRHAFALPAGASMLQLMSNRAGGGSCCMASTISCVIRVFSFSAFGFLMRFLYAHRSNPPNVRCQHALHCHARILHLRFSEPPSHLCCHLSSHQNCAPQATSFGRRCDVSHFCRLSLSPPTPQSFGGNVLQHVHVRTGDAV